jgi:hypothetical protein
LGYVGDFCFVSLVTSFGFPAINLSLSLLTFVSLMPGAEDPPLTFTAQLSEVTWENAQKNQQLSLV